MTVSICSTVAIERYGASAVVRIDRESKRNALDRATRTGLQDAFAALHGQARVIVLTGTGQSFCSGLDLKERASEREAGRQDTAGTEAIALNMAIREHPAIFLAAVNGLALGGGVTLINMCDLAVAAADAELGAPEISFATYASMAGPTVQLLLTRKRAAEFLLCNERLDAATACAWGLLNAVVPRDRLMAHCHALAARIGTFDAGALAETKRALNHVPSTIPDWRGALEYGQTVNAAIRAGRDGSKR